MQSERCRGRQAGTFLLSGLAAVLLVLGGCNGGSQSPPAVAIVGSDKLTIDELASEIPAEMENLVTREQTQEYVQRWINSQLLLQEAKRRGLEKKVDFQRELQRMERELLVSKLLEEELDAQRLVSEDDLRSYYEENKASFERQSDAVHLLHLLLPTKEEADAAMARLRKGEEFEVVAQDLVSADGKDNREDEWDLGLVSANELLPELSPRVFRARSGSVVPPIRTDFGYHICKVLEKEQKGSVKSFEEVKEEIAIKLTAQKRQQRFQQLLSRLRSETEIVTNYQLLDRVVKNTSANRGGVAQTAEH